MDQVFIKVKTTKNGVFKAIDKDIMECTHQERLNYYLSISKGGIVDILEKMGGFKK